MSIKTKREHGKTDDWESIAERAASTVSGKRCPCTAPGRAVALGWTDYSTQPIAVFVLEDP